MANVTILTAIWGVAAVELGLQAGIVLNAYRLTKVTGSFRAWTLIIIAFALPTVSSLYGIVLIATNPDLIVNLFSSLNFSSIVFSYALSLGTSVLLFVGTFDLLRRFKRSAKPQ